MFSSGGPSVSHHTLEGINEGEEEEEAGIVSCRLVFAAQVLVPKCAGRTPTASRVVNYPALEGAEDTAASCSS